MSANAKELRTVIDHLTLIKAHLRCLMRSTERLAQEGYTPAGIVELRRGSLDVRMIVEELMLLSVSAHERSGKEMAKAIRTEYRADKKMSRLRSLNPRFFPDAIDVIPTDEPSLAGRFVPVQEAYLTAEAAEAFYHAADSILHASWSVLSEPAFDVQLERLAEFYRLADRLLQTFEIDISGAGFMVLGHLNLDSDLSPTAFDARRADLGEPSPV